MVRVDPANLQSLVHRQVQLWESQRRKARERPAAAAARVEEGPWLTVSRQIGSSGGQVIAAVSRHLDWNVFDHEIVDAIARESRVKDAILERLDEREVGWFEDTVSKLFVPEDPGQSAFVHDLMRVVWTLAHKGQAIIIGRGANWLLDPRAGLRVRLVAPLEQRVERIAAARSLSSGQARQLAQSDDSAKGGFVHKVFRRRIDDPEGYDLTLNTGTLAPEGAAEVIVTALRRKLGEAFRDRR